MVCTLIFWSTMSFFPRLLPFELWRSVLSKHRTSRGSVFVLVLKDTDKYRSYKHRMFPCRFHQAIFWLMVGSLVLRFAKPSSHVCCFVKRNRKGLPRLCASLWSVCVLYLKEDKYHNRQFLPSRTLSNKCIDYREMFRHNSKPSTIPWVIIISFDSSLNGMHGGELLCHSAINASVFGWSIISCTSFQCIVSDCFRLLEVLRMAYLEILNRLQVFLSLGQLYPQICGCFVSNAACSKPLGDSRCCNRDCGNPHFCHNAHVFHVLNVETTSRSDHDLVHLCISAA